MDLTAVKNAYTIFPMPNASEFWAAQRTSATSLLKLKAEVFSPGVVFRTKYKTKSGYQYFLVVPTGGYREVLAHEFETFLAKATPPVTADVVPATKPLDMSVRSVAKPEPVKAAEPVAPVAEKPSTLKSVVDVDIALAAVACPHCKQVFALRLNQSELVEDVALKAGVVVQATEEQAKAALEAVTEALPVTAAPVPEPIAEAAAPVAEVAESLGLRYVCVPGADLSMADIEAVELLVRRGAARSQDMLDRLRSSKGIAVAFKDDTVVACLGYQSKPADYIEKTNRKATATVPTDALELSWIRVISEYTGSRRDEVIVNMYEALRSLKANNTAIAGKAVYAVYNTSDVEGYAAMELLGLRKHDREHDSAVSTKKAQLFLV